MKKVLVYFLCYLVVFSPIATFAAEFTIPSSRVIDWSYAGASEWYPDTRTSACNHPTYGTMLSPGECNGDSNCSPEIDAYMTWCSSNSPDTVAYLDSGTFPCDSTITLSGVNDVTLRGQGMGSTILQITSNIGGTYGTLFSFESSDYNFSTNSDIAISSGNTKGSTQITTSSSHGLSVDDYVIIDQLNASGWNACNWCTRCNDGACSGQSGERAKGQVVKVTSIDSSTQFSFTPPLYEDYTGSSPAINEHAAYNENLSFENFTVDNSSHYAGRPFLSYGLYNTIFYDVEVDGLKYNSASAVFYIRASSFNTWNRLYIHDGQSKSTDNGYGVCLGYACSNNLVTNSVFKALVIGPVIEGNGSGNVFSYNYTVDMYDVDASGYTPHAIMIHGGGANWNLWEGNHINEGHFRMDAWFGSSYHITLFRNRALADPSGTGYNTPVNIEFWNHNSNVIGNVWGADGVETVYECEETINDCAHTVRSIYLTGYCAGGGCGDTTDPDTRSTMLRHANWNYLSDAVINCDDSVGGEAEPGCQSATNYDYPTDTIDNSLYLSSKPDFFGSMTWPPIVPNGPSVNDIPAKYAYDNISGGIPQWPEENQTTSEFQIGGTFSIGGN